MRSTILLAFSLASIPIAFAQQKVSTSARCGSDFGGRTCKGSTFGNCCSQYSYCGSTEAYCGKGCQAGFGDCVQVPKSSSVSKPSTTSTVIVSQSTRTFVSAPASTLKVTTNARCGKEGNDRTCKGSKWGNCCSQYSYCGSTDAYCGKGCQSVFGDCKGSVSSSSRVVSSTRTFSSIKTSSSSSISSVFSTSAATSSSVVSSSPAASSSSVPSSSSTASSSSDVSSSVVPSSSSLASSSIIASSTAMSSTVLSSSSSAAPSPTSLTSSDIVSTTTVASSSTIESSSVVSSSSTVESSSVIPLSTIASSSAIITSSDIPSSTIASPSATPTPQGTSCPNIGATFTASNGKVYNVNCNGFYPIRGGGVVGTSNQPTLAGCLESCAQNSQCIAADYNPNSGLCDLANSNVSGLVSGFNSGRLVGS